MRPRRRAGFGTRGCVGHGEEREEGRALGAGARRVRDVRWQAELAKGAGEGKEEEREGEGEKKIEKKKRKWKREKKEKGGKKKEGGIRGVTDARSATRGAWARECGARVEGDTGC